MNRKQLIKLYSLVCVLAVLGGSVGSFLTAQIMQSQTVYTSVDNQSNSVFVEESLTIDAIKKVNPSVVSIIASKQLAALRRPTSLFDLFAPDFGFESPRFNGSPNMQDGPKQKIGGGTGFIISADGLVLTNKHVIEDESAEYSTVLSDGEQMYAKVLSKDPLNDIAFIQLFLDEELKTKPENLPIVSLGDSDLLPVGSKVIAIGNALSEFDNTTTSGIISGLGRSITAASGMGGASKLSNLLQTDASINPGNSGGPLVNLNGEVIGINTAIAQSANGIGFAIPINEAKNLVETVLEFGKIIRPMLGVRYVEITPQIAEQMELGVNYGAFLQDDIQSGTRAVVSNGPADKAGLRAGDIILQINDILIDEKNTLQRIISSFKPNQEVNITIFRDGAKKTLNVELGEF